jgi:hypothetical protein
VRTILAATAAAAMVALPTVAQAGPRFDYAQMFTTPVPGASTGSDTQILYKHPDDPNAKPPAVRQEVFTFPEGTTWDNDVVPDCDATEAQLDLMGEAACPPESRIGGGEGTFMSGFGSGESVLEVDVFDDGPDFLILGGSQDPPIRFATRATREGRTITVNVPRSPGGPPDGEAAIRRVHNVFDARTLGDRAYMRTPPVCPASGVWTFHARLTFADGGVEENSYDMPCSRDATAPRIHVKGVSRRRCAARRLRVGVRVVDSSSLAHVRVRLDGRRVRKTTRARFKVRLRRLRPGGHRLAVIARDVAGNRARRVVRFSRCDRSARAASRQARAGARDEHQGAAGDR